MPGSAARITVVVPTYRRPDQLIQCLLGLLDQSRPADEIVVVHRSDDEETVRRLSGMTEVVGIAVTDPGVLAAMNAGVAASTGDIIAFIDDDAVPRREWVAGLGAHLEDPTVGGVGGRDVVHSEPDPHAVNSAAVGLITRWGKLIGNHHLGSGPARDVAVLKAVNMAFRREALALPLVLRGAGAQVHFEVAVGLWARQRGWRLVYDPALLVDHYPGPRFDADRRGRPDPVTAADAAYNLVACLVSLQPEIRYRRAAYGLVIGDAMTPGLLRAAIALARRESTVLRRFLPSLRGQVEALRDHRAGREIEMAAASPLPRAK